jgi:hypothetical protein
MFRLKWRVSRRQQCSRLRRQFQSVASFSYLLYGLRDALPNVRTFAFSNRLEEVSDQFPRQATRSRDRETLFDWGKGTPPTAARSWIFANSR